MRRAGSATAPTRMDAETSRHGVLFFGLHQLGVAALTALVAAGYEIAGVVTGPDPAEEVQPVAALAEKLNLPLFRPSALAPETIADLSALDPRLIAVAGYHQIIPEALLDLPPLGAINLHGSLLPRYRGPTPWKWAILRGEHEIGATAHVMTSGIDRGDILGQVAVPIADDDTGETLFRKIAAAGAPLLADVVGQVMAGTARPRAQDEAMASYFAALSDEDCRIDWTRDAVAIRNLIRGLNLRPGAWTLVAGRRWRVMAATLSMQASAADPGTLLETTPRGWRVATRTHDLWLEDLHPDEPTGPKAASPPSCQAAVAPGLVLGGPAGGRRP